MKEKKRKKMLVLQITVFGIMIVGLIVRKLGIVSSEARKDLTDLVINVVLPCNIITSFITRFSTDLIRECVTVLLISVGIQIFSVIYGKILYRNESPDRSMNLRYGIICSNAGFLGNPIAEGLYGPTGLMLASKSDRDPAFATKLVVFSTLCSIPAIIIWSAILI